MVRKIKNFFSNNQNDKISELNQIIQDGMQKNLDLQKFANELLDEIEEVKQENAFLKSQLKEFKNIKIDTFRTKKSIIENKIIEILKNDENITRTELAKKLNISRQALYKSYKHLL